MIVARLRVEEMLHPFPPNSSIRAGQHGSIPFSLSSRPDSASKFRAGVSFFDGALEAPALRAEMLTALRAALPPQAFAGLLNMLRPHLIKSDWRKLTQALAIAPAAA